MIGFIFNIYPLSSGFESRIYRISRITENVFGLEVRVICRGLLFALPSADALCIGFYFPHCRDAMLRVFSPTGFIFEIYPFSPGFESRIVRIIGFHGWWWMSSVWW